MTITRLRQSDIFISNSFLYLNLAGYTDSSEVFGEHSASYSQTNYQLIFTFFSGSVDWSITSEFPEFGVIEISLKFTVLHLGTQVHLTPRNRLCEFWIY